MENVSVVVFWTYLSLTAVYVAFNDVGSIEGIWRWINIALGSMKTTLEVLPMSLQYLRDITEKRVEAETQMLFVVQ